MASIVKTPSGKFRAFIHVNGIRDSNIFPSRKKAQSWAKDREVELQKHAGIVHDNYTPGDLLNKYAKEVSPSKKGNDKEILRIESFIANYPKLVAIKLIRLAREDLENWITKRLKKVKPSTVNRELNLISHALTKARVWRLMTHNPFADLERPTDPPPRFRRIEPDEITIMCHALNYQPDLAITEKRQFVAVGWLLAIETCMRQGEICGLTPNTVDFNKGVAHLGDTKNGAARDVPLSPSAIALLKKLPTPKTAHHPFFQMKASSMSSTFRKYRKTTSIANLTFHDSRHEAITRLVDSNRYNVLEVASITGHKDIKELMTYYNKTAAQIAADMAKCLDTKPKADVSNTIDLNDLVNVEGFKHIIKEALAEQLQQH
ncbi:site-specific integrase [Pleionea sp. CnH1-48]|uniref:tyrosine-type recombinase/integrase n=1 Tax=Pleionea sp. CnH1-48 TaxID=2954494 RepID=UPI002096EC9F|nr:site-specific integrase [Pleionea sp. CnH1-48]MCO7225061.1 site-specific integrase [Pleionea sp. CnH1-48]